jgi:hypothetical protein
MKQSLAHFFACTPGYLSSKTCSHGFCSDVHGNANKPYWRYLAASVGVAWHPGCIYAQNRIQQSGMEALSRLRKIGRLFHQALGLG